MYTFHIIFKDFLFHFVCVVHRAISILTRLSPWPTDFWPITERLFVAIGHHISMWPKYTIFYKSRERLFTTAKHHKSICIIGTYFYILLLTRQRGLYQLVLDKSQRGSFAAAEDHKSICRMGSYCYILILTRQHSGLYQLVLDKSQKGYLWPQNTTNPFVECALTAIYININKATLMVIILVVEYMILIVLH